MIATSPARSAGDTSGSFEADEDPGASREVHHVVDTRVLMKTTIAGIYAIIDAGAVKLSSQSRRKLSLRSYVVARVLAEEEIEALPG